MASAFDNLLPPTRPVSAVLTDDPDAAWSQVQTWGDELDDGSRMVSCRWASIPPIERLIDDVVRAFAGIALADWPHWYGTDLSAADGSGNTFERNQDVRGKLRTVSRRQVRAAKPWLRRSVERCLRGEVPFSAGDNVELQAGQLSLAVCPNRLIVVLTAGPDAPAAGAFSLAAAAEWLHRVTGAWAMVVAPLAWRGAAGLDRLWVAPEVIRFSSPASNTCGGTAVTTESGPEIESAGTTAASKSTANNAAPSGPTVAATPLSGRPHPNSEAERLLFDRIQADPMLAALLAFNQTVGVDLGQKFRVDVLSADRRLVIEVDGRDHWGVASKYIADCERDYQLMKHGYVVLRLPNELVLCNLDVAVARIRDILSGRAGIDGTAAGKGE